MAHITKLQLTNFRCYESADLDRLPAGLIVLHGPNGAGKTNVLEAVSFLSPGRGLRGAKVTEVQKQDAHGPEAAWAVSGLVETAYGAIRIGTGMSANGDKRLVRINGEAARGQSALAEYLSCVWLTPQMDRLFLGGAADRRRFLDRLVFAFDPSHSGRITRYENALRQRAKILQESHGRPDPVWLDGLEESMAETGVAIAAARLHLIERLQQVCALEKNIYFPAALLRAAGTIEELLRYSPAVEVEELFRYQLKKTREADSLTGGAATGPHKSDLAVVYRDKNMAAEQCSTGEQKALLIGIILAHAHLIAAETGAPPILLLDEVAAHLDEQRRAALYDILIASGGQIWLTGADKILFATRAQDMMFFHIHNSRIDDAARERAA